jgi:CubicO group peptidase (beta-lactamase class C family)
MNINNALSYFDQNQIQQLDASIITIMNEQQIPGYAIAVIGENNVIYKKFAGNLNDKSNKKIAGNTIFQVASLSKGFLGGLLAIMAEQRQLNWHSTVISEIKDFKLKNNDYSKILTFHHIASMQTGLPEFAGNEFLPDSSSRSEIIASLGKVDSIYPPGERKFAYQYAILSVFEELIKKKTGTEWEKILQKKLLEPLKLINTGVDITQLNNKSNVAACVDESNNQIDFDQFKVNSAAGMYSSLNDLTKWTQLHIRDGNIGNKQIISKAEINKMRLAYTPIENYDGFLIPNPSIEKLAYGHFWKNYSYRGKSSNLKIIEHNGNSTGVSSIIAYIPDKKIGIIVLTNKFTSAPEQIRDSFLQILTN